MPGDAFDRQRVMCGFDQGLIEWQVVRLSFRKNFARNDYKLLYKLLEFVIFVINLIEFVIIGYNLL